MSDMIGSFIYLVVAVFLGFVMAIFVGITMDVITDVGDESISVTSPLFENVMLRVQTNVNISYWVPYVLAASGVLFVVVTVLHKLLYSRRDEYEEY